jgi:hypothetical protein
MDDTVYYQAVSITRDYLGPAAQRFIDRQVSFHLQKDPSALELDDLPQLAEWIKVSISVLTEDNALVEDFAHRLLSLTQAPQYG